MEKEKWKKKKGVKSERNTEIEMNEIRRLADYNVFSSGSY